ncbi:aspartate ammonia-lyase [Paenarthrobacter ureafaciens]|jgi:aspartate ammonia-lyase|uniref:aspartate ammonia-lyase n=1 Tax=Paenarthrobacter ureafaciens TaxID=37931 RepID=UPI001917786A|nr:aspartate ammonia-lyase [Paenarthrobacter ureafaciens]QQQ62273.1 aspartate ammonia-lyase [Paenarthrobacter ureafaciens]UOD81299.1 aspartate ammonia-lyase [Paenarthrobacter ureafaciens]WNZ03949.1 aspartate ammonia-lyase [Paenarthrobacter ureafaciens]
MDYRLEEDSLGRVKVPANAYWGAHTARALDNFPISGITLAQHPRLVTSLAMVKRAAALTNGNIGTLDATIARAISRACEAVETGGFRDQFCVDVIQGGAGTSTNMNANEVIANIALESLGHPLGSYEHLHPIDHVNRCQSTNDVYPTALKLALAGSVEELCHELDHLAAAFHHKGAAFAHILKMGRTQLQDAVPMSLGQEFHAFAATILEDRQRLKESAALLLECSLGATAVGTGITAEPGYRQEVVDVLAHITGRKLVPAENLIEATSDVGAFMHLSGMLKRSAIKLSKISSDLRLLSSGPQNGLGELRLPPRQAGSSIMPGKVNPVIPEALNQIAFAVAGADTTVTMAADNGQLQLNAFEPVIGHVLLQGLAWLTNGARILRTHCVDGVEANEEDLQRRAAGSAGLATAFIPAIGYAAAAAVAKQALRNNIPVREAVTSLGFMDTNAAGNIVAQAVGMPLPDTTY